MSYKKCGDMSEVREEIDRLDREIVPLLVERLHYIKEAGRIKEHRGHVHDDWRIEDVIAKCLETTQKHSGNEKMIEDIYRFIINWSIQHEFSIWDQHHTKG